MSLTWRGVAVDPRTAVPPDAEWQQVEVPGRPVEFAGADAVAYRTEFSDPRTGDEEHVLLVLKGVYAHASVRLNGTEITTHNVYFEPLRVPLPVREENKLLVVCKAPTDRFGGIHDTDRVPDEQSVPGIRWEASIETHPDPYIESLPAKPRLDTNEATIAVAPRVVTNESISDRLTLSLRPSGTSGGGGAMNRVAIETDQDRTSVDHHFTVRDPSLWWPHDVGEQPRYTIRAKLGESERTVETALRSITYDDDGLCVNGERISVRGVNLKDGRPSDIETAISANANLVRANAHVLSDEVYDTCDELGVLVWQDLPLTGTGTFDVERGQDLIGRLVSGRSNRPSLAVVSVHDEPVPDIGSGLGTGLVDRLRYRYRTWRTDYDPESARSIASVVDDVPTVPVVGTPGISVDAQTIYPGWNFGRAEDTDWLCDRFDLGGPIVGFGAGAYTTAEAANATADVAGFDSERHSARMTGDVEESQAYQATVVGRVAESLRLRNVPVLSVHALRDVEETGGMGLVANDGTEKAAFAGLRSAYQPVQAVLSDPTPGKADLVVIHDRSTSAEVTAEWDINGDRRQEKLTLGPFDRDSVTTLSLDVGDEVTLAVATETDIARNEYVI